MRSAGSILLGVLATCISLSAQNPVPLINNPLVPESAAPGAAGFQLTVNGVGFVSGSVVNWNGSPRSTSFVSSSQLKASILASDLAALGTVFVTVSSPTPGGGVSNTATFEVTLPAPSEGFTSTSTNETNSCTKSVLFPQIVADFNGDGKQDVAGTVCKGGFLYISLGNGDGTFQAPIYTALLPSPGTMVAGDFNGDGKLDLAVINDTNNVALLLGNGDGTFQAAKNFLTGLGADTLAVGDFNGDGKLDLILTANTANDIDTLLGNGDGTFKPYIASSTGGAFPFGLAIGDFNGDGKLDLVTSESGSSEVTVMFGNGDGTFTFNTNYFANLSFIIAVDMNGDGILDLVGLGSPLSGGTTGIAIMYGNPGGTFQNPVQVSTPTVPFQSYNAFGIADLNGDGKLDFWAIGSAGDNLGTSIFSILGNGNGTFQTPGLYSVAPAGFNAGPMVEGDFNNDGKPDFQLNNSCLGVSCMTVVLQSPVVTAPTVLSFGTTLIGVHSRIQTVTLTNAGLTAVSITGVSITGGFSADFSETNNCPSSLGSTLSCTIQVSFDPSTENNFEFATLSIADSGPGGGQQVPMSGLGTYIRLSPATLNFGSVAVGQSSTLVSTMTNTKTSAITVQRIYVKPSPEGRQFTETNNCGTSIAAGAQCQITVTFTPTSTGHKAAHIVEQLSGDAPPELTLSGTGT